MASLLERLSIPASSAGPVRRIRSSKGDSSPYAKPDPLPPKGDVDGQWTHDLFDKDNNTLGNRLSDKPASRNPPRYNAGAAARALSEATGAASQGGSINIKGASVGGMGNVVEVRGLVSGTSAEDVKAIFQQCGPVTEAKPMSKPGANEVVVRIVYKHPKDAQSAVSKFDGQNADGRRLGVRILGSVSADLSYRLGNPPTVDGSVDVLLGEAEGGSKMRSDAIMATDARATILVAPPGANPAEYTQGNARGNGRRGRGRGRGNRQGGRRGRGETMDVDK